MPTYEYRCLGCGKVFQCVEKMREHRPDYVHRKCPKCESKHVEQIFTAPYVHTTKKS